MSVRKLFRGLKKDGKKALLPFLTVGDPSAAATVELAQVMEKAGAHGMEMGLPFSDPLADGPTIQASSQRALTSGFTVAKYLKTLAEVKKKTSFPLIAMTYYNPVFKMGLDTFAKRLAAAGACAAIIPDLPPEEALPWARAAKQNSIETIFLVAPNTPDERVIKADKLSTGFLYYVSVTGVTGARKALPRDILDNLRRVRRLAKNPVVVGFGVSGPRQARLLKDEAHGVIVGSALVDLAHRSYGKKGWKKKVGSFVERLIRAMG